MKLHLVGGFLGSGKTTAISNAVKVLLSRDVKTSVITNDQGNYLVDSAFISAANIGVGEVTGGCFCCNYNELDAQINELRDEANPSVIFAETVGSCTDLVATVLKPLLEYRNTDIDEITFSSFVDARLLLMHLLGIQLPFTAETNYIWEKQVEEAEILVINKIDLLSAEESVRLKGLAREKLSGKFLLFQNSLSLASVGDWIAVLDQPGKSTEHKSIGIDYEIYGAGEANLAWLDEEIVIRSASNRAMQVAAAFIDRFSGKISDAGLAIGHLKFLLTYGNKSQKISFTTLSTRQQEKIETSHEIGTAHLMVNARIETSPENLRSLVVETLSELSSMHDVTLSENCVSCFSPGFPNPTHRIS